MHSLDRKMVDGKPLSIIHYFLLALCVSSKHQAVLSTPQKRKKKKKVRSTLHTCTSNSMSLCFCFCFFSHLFFSLKRVCTLAIIKQCVYPSCYNHRIISGLNAWLRLMGVYIWRILKPLFSFSFSQKIKYRLMYKVENWQCCWG